VDISAAVGKIFTRLERMFDTTATEDRTALETLAPGPELARHLADLDPRELSGYDLVSFLGATERQASWTASRQLAAIAELAHRRPMTAVEVGDPGDRSLRGQVSRFAAHEVALELKVSRRTAENIIDLALQLERLPGAWRSLESGRVDLRKVRALADAVRELPPDLARAVEDRVLPRAREQVVGDFKGSVARAVLRVDPAAARTRHTRSVADRKVELVPLADGMAGLWAYLRADHAVAFFEGLTALAERAKGPGDERTLDQRRADVLCDVGEETLARDDLPRRHGRRPHLLVTAAASTLLGLDDCPGELAGYGPIPADLAREIAGDADWTRVLTDPRSGTLLDYGTTVYRPPQSLADRVVAKHQRCRQPGCRLPAARCQIDHTRRFPEGSTAEGNLGPLCVPDHLCKHSPGWSCEQRDSGDFLWTTPSGHTYRDRLQPVLEPLEPVPISGDPVRDDPPF
jgi:hypothetical protein